MRIIPVLLVVIGLYSQWYAVSAQESETQPFISRDGSFSFGYPVDWHLENFGGEWEKIKVTLYNTENVLSPDAIMIDISYPTDLSQFTMMGLADSPSEIVFNTSQFSQAFAGVFSEMMIQKENFDPQSVQITPVDVPLVEFNNNGLPGAYATQINNVGGIETALMFAVVDVGSDHLVTLTMTSILNGGKVLIDHQDDALAIISSMKYSSEIVTSGDANLPQVYRGNVGAFIRGRLTFFYPDGWYVATVDKVYVQNASTRMELSNLEKGQLWISIADPELARSVIEYRNQSRNCDDSLTLDISAMSVALAQLPCNVEEAQRHETEDIKFADMGTLDLKGKNAAFVRMSQGEQDILLIAVDTGNSNIITLSAYTPTGEILKYEETLFALAATFEYFPLPSEQSTSNS